MSDEQQEKKKREPLKLWITTDANGGVLIRGQQDALKQFTALCDKAIDRLEDGDGSISYPMAKGKGTAPLTVVCF